MSGKKLTEVVEASDKLKRDIKSSLENLEGLIENIRHAEKDQQKKAILALIQKEIPSQFQQKFYMNLADVALFERDLKLRNLALLALAKHIQKDDARKFLSEESAEARAVQKRCWEALLNIGAVQECATLCKDVGEVLINFVKVMPERLWRDNIGANMAALFHSSEGKAMRKNAIGLIKKLFIESPPSEAQFQHLVFLLQGREKVGQSKSVIADKVLPEAVVSAPSVLDAKIAETNISGKNFYPALQSSFWERRFPAVNASGRRSASLPAPIIIPQPNEEDNPEFPEVYLSPL